jgi:hypothetical protein
MRAELGRTGALERGWLSGRREGVGGGPPDFQEWAESLTELKREEEKEKGKESLSTFFRIYFQEKNNIEIAR